ncbi:unnamed protein product [Pleuronectes platessa]|uniref:Uncharacterized protein n=1 Tax=Pleuronectes platessa TaxID=8262 RepID=A0A9N7W2J6_PLEPL|nr:unnamed protein product [Pleuronectes platessa]
MRRQNLTQPSHELISFRQSPGFDMSRVLADMTHSSMQRPSGVQLSHVETCAGGGGRLSDPLHVSLGPVETTEPVGRTSRPDAFTRGPQTSLMVCLLKAWLLVWVLAEAGERAARLTGR